MKSEAFEFFIIDEIAFAQAWGMKNAVQKNNLGGQILYIILDPSKNEYFI